MKRIQILTMTILLLVFSSLPAFSRQVTLYWEPSPSPGVIGYKVYYQQAPLQLPLSGTEADQGSSPVDAENSLILTLSGLDDTAVYYFSVTAYDGNFNESTFSNIVSTAWMPPLRNPQKESVVIPWNVTFQWDAGPPEHYLNYTLYYGTDRDQVVNAGAPFFSFRSFPAPPPLLPLQGLTTVIALLLLSALFIRATNSRLSSSCPQKVTFAALFIFVLAACGGGGGSGWSGESLSFSSTALTRVNTGGSTSHQTNDLESGTTYYWKVDAHSTTEPGTVYHSEVYSFTTE